MESQARIKTESISEGDDAVDSGLSRHYLGVSATSEALQAK